MGFKTRQKRGKAHFKGTKIKHSKHHKNKQDNRKSSKEVDEVEDGAKEGQEEVMELDGSVNESQAKRKSLSLDALKQRKQINRVKVIQNIQMIAMNNLGSTATSTREDVKESAENEEQDLKEIQPRLSNLSSFYKEFNRVIEAADVIVQVLDARDPLGTRCEEIEKAVIAAGPSKKLILLLNKVDLIPVENLRLWLKYLRNEFPTVAFKSSTQKQSSNLGRINKSLLYATNSMMGSSKCMGANILMKILGNYCKNSGIRTVINVGVVGYPNVGKSSVINSLIRNRACTVGSTPGVTKSIQYIHLDSKIRLLDSPGVVFAKGSSQDSAVQEATLALRNCVKIEQLHNPRVPIEAIMSRVSKFDLREYYKIEDFDTVDQFLYLLARRYGKLKKGGIPDVYAAAKIVLQDWNSGRIRYYTHPPEVHDMPCYISTEVVTEMSKGFDIDEKFAKEEMVEMEREHHELIANKLSSLPVVPTHVRAMDESSSTEKMDEAINSQEMDDKALIKGILKKNTQVEFRKRKRNLSFSNEEDERIGLQGMQLNRERMLEFKRKQKRQKKINKVSEKISANLEESLKIF